MMESIWLFCSKNWVAPAPVFCKERHASRKAIHFFWEGLFSRGISGMVWSWKLGYQFGIVPSFPRWFVLNLASPSHQESGGRFHLNNWKGLDITHNPCKVDLPTFALMCLVNVFIYCKCIAPYTDCLGESISKLEDCMVKLIGFKCMIRSIGSPRHRDNKRGRGLPLASRFWSFTSSSNLVFVVTISIIIFKFTNNNHKLYHDRFLHVLFGFMVWY